jgi:hypothetical protein
MIKNKDALLFDLEFYGFNAPLEIGATYVTPEDTVGFWKNEKQGLEWV